MGFSNGGSGRCSSPASSRIQNRPPPAGVLLTVGDTTDAKQLVPHFADADGNLSLRVQALVLEMGGRTAVVDRCVGNGKPRPQFFWNDQLNAAIARASRSLKQPCSYSPARIHTTRRPLSQWRTATRWPRNDFP
jgi:hypothetical protein